METTYSRRSDDTLKEADESRNVGEPIAIRIQPQLYIRKANPRQGGGYQRYYAWKGVYWRAKCKSQTEAKALRDALGSLFLLLQVLDAKQVRQLLDATRKNVVESARSPEQDQQDQTAPSAEISGGIEQPVRDIEVDRQG